MADDVRAPTCHDALFHDVFSRPDAFALVLRRLLPKEVLPHVDFASLRPAPTKQTDERLRTRWPDLRYVVDVVDGDTRVPVQLPIEHQSTPAPLLPRRSHGYVSGLWDEHAKANPRDDTVPFVIPVAFLQHPARNTPVRLSEIQPMPPRLRALLGTPVELTMLVDDFSGSVMGDTTVDLPTRAFVELARAFMHGYENAGALTKARLRELAPLFDILLEHKRPGDIRTLWVYVIGAYEEGSPLRDLITNAVSKEVKEEFMTIKDAWIAEGRTEGEAKGRTEGQAKLLLRLLESRAILISEAIRARVLDTRDESLLLRWFDRALSMATAEEVFAPLEAGS
jgi:predicted transposase YdaD